MKIRLMTLLLTALLAGGITISVSSIAYAAEPECEGIVELDDWVDFDPLCTLNPPIIVPK